jgi:hypothetical protein
MPPHAAQYSMYIIDNSKPHYYVLKFQNCQGPKKVTFTILCTIESTYLSVMQIPYDIRNTPLSTPSLPCITAVTAVVLQALTGLTRQETLSISLCSKRGRSQEELAA